MSLQAASLKQEGGVTKLLIKPEGGAMKEGGDEERDLRVPGSK
jgi:hypothetical protein